MFGFTQKKCVSFFRCESMWTAILMGVIALIFFVPYIFVTLTDIEEMALMWLLMWAFFFISLFVWSEQAYDEREEGQQLQMNKWSFVTGGGAIIAIIIYQSFTTWVDLALPAVLLVMLGTKLLMKNYYRLKDK